jgi:hypothetical protein
MRYVTRSQINETHFFKCQQLSSSGPNEKVRIIILLFCMSSVSKRKNLPSRGLKVRSEPVLMFQRLRLNRHIICMRDASIFSSVGENPRLIDHR